MGNKNSKPEAKPVQTASATASESKPASKPTAAAKVVVPEKKQETRGESEPEKKSEAKPHTTFLGGHVKKGRHNHTGTHSGPSILGTTPHSPVKSEPKSEASTKPGKQTDAKNALTAIFDNTGGNIWFSHQCWGSDEPFPAWTWNNVNGDRRGIIEVDEGGLPTVLNLKGNNLHGNIPDAIGSLSTLTSVDFSDNYLTSFSPLSKSKLKNLVSISLDNNQLNQVPIFDDLTHLTHFSALHNPLSQPLPNWLSSSNHLTVLRLSSDRTHERTGLSDQLSTDLSCPLSSLSETLTVLELSGFAISQFPVWLISRPKSLLRGDAHMSWPCLIELNLSLNSLSTSLPVIDFNPFPVLNIFSLHSCGLLTSPPLVYLSKSSSSSSLPIEEIYLGKNQISELSSVLLYSTCSKLYLARNRLSVLPSPSEVSYFSIIELWLARNELTGLPKDFSSCLGGCLVKLDLSGNRFSHWTNEADNESSLATGVRGLNQLKRLDVSGNDLCDAVPDGMLDDGLFHLQEFLAIGCRFVETDAGKERIRKMVASGCRLHLN